MKHNSTELKDSLTIEDIKTLLYELGAEDILHNETKEELTTNTICHNISGGSHKLYYAERFKSFKCFTTCSCNMDIYELVRKVYELKGATIHFSDIINWVAQKTGKSFGFGASVSLSETKDTLEMEWMNKFNRKKVELPELKIHSKRILDVFSTHYHPAWLSDNIDIPAMKKFDIKFYNKDNRIVIPHYHPTNGGLIGLRGRAMNEWEQDAFKYLPLTIQGEMYNFPSYGQLYGAWHNRETIKKLKKIIIFESEKSVLQCEKYFPDNNFAVSLLGRNISQSQIDMILEMGVKEVVIALDRMHKEPNTPEEERDVEFLLKMGRRLSSYVSTFVLFDTEGLIDYKNSPSDHGKETLISMMKGKQEILNKE